MCSVCPDAQGDLCTMSIRAGSLADDFGVGWRIVLHDASAAVDIARRRGAGNLKHIAMQEFWLQGVALGDRSWPIFCVSGFDACSKADLGGPDLGGRIGQAPWASQPKSELETWNVAQSRAWRPMVGEVATFPAGQTSGRP